MGLLFVRVRDDHYVHVCFFFPNYPLPVYLFTACYNEFHS